MPKKKKIGKSVLKERKNWKGYEKRKARERGATHVGGPGAPDYVRGETKGEIKDWSKSVDKTAVMKEARKGRTEIVSKRGFTEEAIEYAERYRPDVRLIHGRKTVKPRRRKNNFSTMWG